MKVARRLIALNMALLLTVFLYVPSLAVTSTPRYYISVGSTQFYNDTDASGTGWTYTAEYHQLILSNYSGSEIRAYGDLSIYTYGTVNISGSSGTTGADAIASTGNLSIYPRTGSLTIKGGNGSTNNGGTGINSKALYLYSDPSTTLNISGGVGNTYGGRGISGETLYLYPQNATIVGGDSASSPGCGIYFSSYLYVGLCSMTVRGGGTTGYDIATSDGRSFYSHKQVTITKTGTYQRLFTTNTYTLTLNGAGGLLNGSSSTTITGKYPTYSLLSNYPFSRNGYTLLGWSDGTNFVTLNTNYCPETNTSLNAQWAAIDSNSIVFNAMGGTIGSSYYTTKTANGTVNVPSASETINSGKTLIGWTKSYNTNISSANGYIINSGDAWYSPGSSANILGNNVLYASWAKYGLIIRYNSNGGLEAGGGNLMVQGSTTTGDLTMYILDNGSRYSKTNYIFNGWKDINGTSYTAGQALTHKGATLQLIDLYAQWKPADPTLIQSFVTRLYQKCQGRSPDAGGLSYWTGILMSGSMSGSEVAAAFASSSEYVNTVPSDTQFLTMMYKVLLDRDPDSAGLSYWLGLLNSGKTRAWVFASGCTSTEFAGICNIYGITQGSIDASKYNMGTQAAYKELQISNFVTRLYDKCLGRTPDSAGLSDWTGKLISGSVSGSEVAAAFAGSSEYVNTVPSDTQFLNMMYKVLFNRDPDSAGIAYWLGFLNSGKTRAWVFSSGCVSNEFATVCSTYGITQGSIDPTKFNMGTQAAYNAKLTQVRSFVTRLYLKCQNRAPDSAGLDDWTSRLMTGSISGAQVAAEFASSSEYQSTHPTDTQFITMMYKVLFDRDPDSGGMTYWLGFLNSGKTRAWIFSSGCISTEFAAVCNSYGIKQGSIDPTKYNMG